MQNTPKCKLVKVKNKLWSWTSHGFAMSLNSSNLEHQNQFYSLPIVLLRSSL